MRADFVPGATFPDYELSDHTAKRRKVSELQGQHPMVLVLSRGGFCPKGRRQAEGLVELHRELEVAYCRLVTISTDIITETNECRSGVGAHWPFVSDAGRIVQKDLDIAEYTDPVHNPMIPHVIVLEPGLVIYKIYHGYWFFGRPTLEDLRQDARGAEVAADWGGLKSPENYVGYERTENFASPGGAVSEKRHLYAAPAQLKLNHWALPGDWTVEKQLTALNKANGRIAYRFHARDLHLVMGPAARGRSVRFRVLIDGQQPGAAHGIDVDEQGNGTVTEQRLYQLIRQPKPIADRQFEIEFLDPGAQAFAFTFG
jgi:peroxiredoxin